MIWLKGIGRVVLWLLSAAALCALAVGTLLAVPVSAPPPLESIRAGAIRSGRREDSQYGMAGNRTIDRQCAEIGFADERRVEQLVIGRA